MIPAGKLRHHAQLQIDVGTEVDKRNQRIPDWKKVADIRIAIEHLGGNDLELQRTIYTEATHRITARHNPAITKESRIVCRGKVYAIGYIENVDELDYELRLLCSTEQ